MIHLLIGYGADPNACRTDKDTPLHALLHFSGRMDPIKEVSIELSKVTYTSNHVLFVAFNIHSNLSIQLAKTGLYTHLLVHHF